MRNLVKLRLEHIAAQSPMLFVSVLSFLVGLNATISKATGGAAVYFLFPTWAFLVWTSGLMLGGAIIFVTIIFALPAEVERAGLAALVGSGIVYVIGLLVYSVFFNWPAFIIWVTLVITLGMRYWALGSFAKRPVRRH